MLLTEQLSLLGLALLLRPEHEGVEVVEVEKFHSWKGRNFYFLLTPAFPPFQPHHIPPSRPLSHTTSPDLKPLTEIFAPPIAIF